MGARSLAWPSLAVEDRQGLIAHVSPLQPDELLDALAAAVQAAREAGRKYINVASQLLAGDIKSAGAR